MNLPNYFCFRVKENGTEITIEEVHDPDVVPVVRCKNCKWRGATKLSWGSSCYCEYIGDMIPCGDFENYYCAYGEAKE